MISNSLYQPLFKSETVQKSLDVFTQYVKALYGEKLDKIILFGSQARGEANPDSDVDILIVTHKAMTKKDREKLIKLISDIAINDDILISFVEILSSNFKSENSPLLLNIRREGIIL